MNRREVLRNDVRRGENDESEKGYEEENQRDVAAEREMQIDPWPIIDEFVHDEGDDQETAGQQQRVDQPGIEPVETVALIESRIDQAQSDAQIDYSGPVRGLQQRPVHRLAWHAEIDADHHQRREQRRVPEDPFPGPVIAEPTF